MSDPIIKIAKGITGKILAGNPYMPQGSKQLFNKINDLMYRRD